MGRERLRSLLTAGVFLPLAFVASSTASGHPALITHDPLPTAQALVTARATAFRASGQRASFCGQNPELVCTQVSVPLDRTGVVPGTVSLHVEVLPPAGPSRGAMFLIAGGPGQGSAHVFGLGSASGDGLYRFLFPGYTLVAYDDRGTGDSGLLDCPSLQASSLSADAQRAAAAACAASIGPARDFYSTFEHAEDLEAVRQSIGVDKVALWGVSYGTKLALAYALQHPDHVERLLLDSVVPPEGKDPFAADTVRGLPEKLEAFCSDGGCRAATSSFSADVAVVANRLAAKPLNSNVLTASGSTKKEFLDGLNLLSMVLDADLSPGLAAELPAVMHAARAGNTQPLLRLAAIHDAGNAPDAADLSFALYATTVCHDGPFPWAPDTPIAQRQAIYDATVAALPPGTFGPFGTWASRFGNADFCLAWPSPSGGGKLGAGPLPDVPVLAVSGGIDMRTPTANAVAVVARFPHGQLLVVPGVGHSTVTADASGCTVRAVRSWIQGGPVPSTCDRPKPIVAPVPALPAPGLAKPKKPAGPLQTYAIVSTALKDAEALWLTTSDTPIAGIYGGKLVPAARGFTLVRYSIARGVTVSGKINLTKNDLPFTFQGTVTVAGAGASTGLLGLKGASLRGTLGGRVVG